VVMHASGGPAIPAFCSNLLCPPCLPARNRIGEFLNSEKYWPDSLDKAAQNGVWRTLAAKSMPFEGELASSSAAAAAAAASTYRHDRSRLGSKDCTGRNS
jgi:hypothetical protein